VRVRLLIIALVISLLVWTTAAGALVYAQHQAGEERDFLLRFVCESVAIRVERGGPEATEFVVRFGAIMREHGAHCSPFVPGLP